ncbi:MULTISPECIES: potassium-transporting ATPase subunit C [unclassified Microbispora]|uniref:potassium-transporting ATPase subunit C n=1 Tax=unclassified Microbispora TaxID=2614687 RepID=UPI0015FFF108|nr:MULTISPECIES: potassium-transporting ATPase subunit C [unclassified Microbispora]
MKHLPSPIRRHLAAVRAVLVLTVVTGIVYPLAVTGVAQVLFRHQANGSLIERNGRIVGSSLIGQSFTDAAGAPIPRYFQSRPAAPGHVYDTTSSGAGNLGPEDVVDTLPAPGRNGRTSLLTQVCARSLAVGRLEGVSGARPFCTPGGVGAVLKVFPATGAATRVVSVNQACPATPFVPRYQGVRVECARPGEDYSAGRTVPVRGAVARVAVPPDAVTAGASGLDPHISVAYAVLQAPRVARARGRTVERVMDLVRRHTVGPWLGYVGRPVVNVLELNLALDEE